MRVSRAPLADTRFPSTKKVATASCALRAVSYTHLDVYKRQGLSGCHSEDTFEGFPIVQIRLNGNIVETDVPAIDIKGNTMIPLNIVSESLGASIDIDSDAKIVSIDLRNIETVQYELEQARQRIAKLANAMRSENMLPAPSNPVKLDRPYVLLSAGIGPDCPFVSKFGRGGLIGSGMNYIYDSIGQYSGSVLARDSILVFSLDHEVSFDILKDWPESLADVLPFTCEELSMYKPPFAVSYTHLEYTSHSQPSVILDRF